MSDQRTVVIAGTGLAGYTLAREWRKLDKERPLVMLTADDGSFYSKPMLSNALAQGKTPQTLAMKTAPRMADELTADIRTNTRIHALDPVARSLDLGDSTLSYDDLVLALGAEPVRIPLAGDAAGDLLSVNSLADYARFRTALADARSVAVMGPGLIGCEFANDLISQGIEVNIFGPDPWPVSTLLPHAAGRALQQALEGVGIRLHLGTTAESIDRAGNRCRIALDNGSTLETDLVLSAVGLRPVTTLAGSAGLAVERGIVADRLLRTSDPRIYALGDCAQVAGLNLPFVMPIMHAARALARTLAGEPTEVGYPAMPVVIKTPALAIVVAPPPRDAEGEWMVEGDGTDIRATFLSPEGALLGFALTGEAAAEKQALTKILPAVL